MNMESQVLRQILLSPRLSNEQKVLKWLNDIMVHFEQEISQSNSTSGSKQEKVNRALAKLQTALRAQDASSK